MNKVWKDAIGYEGLYEISEDKIIRNKSTHYELKQYTPKHGKSLYVALTQNKQTKPIRVETMYRRVFGNTIDDLQGEYWIDIVGYEDVYKISNCGRIKSLDRYIDQRHKDGYIFKRYVEGRVLSLNRTNGNGYINVQLRNGCFSKSKRNEYVHILVARHFIPNPQNKPTVNHIDGDKSNNNVDNLEWATQSEQMTHAYENNLNNITEYSKGKTPKGSQVSWSKLNEEQAMEIYLLSHSDKHTNQQIGDMYGVSRSTVRFIKNKQTWRHIHQLQTS